jgi:hypothetical protein
MASGPDPQDWRPDPGDKTVGDMMPWAGGMACKVCGKALMELLDQAGASSGRRRGAVWIQVAWGVRRKNPLNLIAAPGDA